MDIRLRNLDPQVEKTLLAIGKDLHEKTAAGTVERLIKNYFTDKSYQAQMSKRNSELHAALAKYVDRESEMKEAIQDFIKYTAQYNKTMLLEVGKIYKKFSGKQAKKKGNRK